MFIKRLAGNPKKKSQTKMNLFLIRTRWLIVKKILGI